MEDKDIRFESVLVSTYQPGDLEQVFFVFSISEPHFFPPIC